MNNRKLKHIVMLALCACMAVSPISGTSGSSSESERESGVVRAAPDTISCSAQTEFAVRIFKENYKNGSENICIAPLSLYSALAMTQNGAAGSTLDQMNMLLGGDAEKINAYMSWYAQSLENDEQFRSANSLWITDNAKLFTPCEKFTDTVKEWYSSEVFLRPFPPEDCSSTIADINAWTQDATDGMIEELLDSIPDDTIMYLTNAAAFDARWEKTYTADKVRPGIFRSADGSEQECDIMYSTERIYISDDFATGFIKPYENGRYSFAAILPNEDMTLDEYVTALTAKRFAGLIASAKTSVVSACVPKFSCEYELEQSDVLKSLGITDAFSDVDADFTAMGTCPPDYVIYINRVLHKTHISVDEEGTRAAAVSSVEMAARMSLMMDEYQVYLDRPFMYAIMDNETGTPVFMGTVNKL